MKQLTEHTTEGQYQPESLQVRRLGSKHKNETETDEARSRPLLVTFPDEDKKASVMKNLYKLKTKGEPFREMIIKHDMSREDREKERLLQKEAREKTAGTNFKFCLHSKRSTRRKTNHQGKKKERNDQPKSDTYVLEK
ncbi:hypothetical protein NP493_26g03045 [Ridgeia piscesae]|uniref:Uncharacterized protein n=1 Tax=Ridgeia piscesae TaxID=27915 RepID=A0AAD9PD52_RIDPI|nr:hypothetical protein NP493_26g03045 [Ridgeia piscesae]